MLVRLYDSYLSFVKKNWFTHFFVDGKKLTRLDKRR